MIKLKTLLQQLLQSPRRFPVELALGVFVTQGRFF